MNAAAGNPGILQKTGGGMTAAFYAVFLFLFTFLTLGILFGSIGYSYNHFLLFALVFLFAAASFALFRIIRMHAETLVKYERLILLLVLSLLFLIQMYLGFRLRFASAFDFASVYRGGGSMGGNGNLFGLLRVLPLFSKQSRRDDAAVSVF